MGSTAVPVSSNTNQTTTPTPTPQETALETLQLQEAQAAAPGNEMVNQAASTDINTLLTGGQLSGNLAKLSGGLDQNTINSLTSQSMQQLYPQFQAGGILNSGTAASVAGETAGSIATGAQEFNINTLLNLLGQGVQGTSSTQQAINTTTGQLTQGLAGLNTTNVTGTGVTTYPSTGMNLGILGSYGTSYYGCWVAAEIYGGWEVPETCAARYYINILAPKWFKDLYLKYGERVASYIHNKPILKNILRPLFDFFVWRGKKQSAEGFSLGRGEKETLCLSI